MNSQEIIDARDELSRELNKCRQDAEVFARLSKAQSRIGQITKELAKLDKDYVEARNSEDKAARELNASKIRNVVIKADDRPLTLATYTISWEYMTYSTNSHGNMWESRTVIGFTALATTHDNIMQYVLDRPALLPAAIRELAPGDPVEAMDRYFRALRHNSVSTGSALTYCP